MNRYFFISSAVAAALLSGCASGSRDSDDRASRNDRNARAANHGHDRGGVLASIREAVCVLAPTEGNRTEGWVRFVERANGTVLITAEVTGLTPDAQHAIHIHEFGDMTSADGMATGSHYNPENHPHGLPEQRERHAGDFGNLQANGRGVAGLELEVRNLSIAGEKNPVIGRAIIVHAKQDDGSQPVGNAGARIAQGVIGVAKGD